MTYADLQNLVRSYRDRGFNTPALNSSYAVLVSAAWRCQDADLSADNDD
jgi:hypothetical protein